MRNNKRLIHPAIQARVDFYEQLEDDLKKASDINEISIIYAKFCNYCSNLGIVHAFNNIFFGDIVINEEFKLEKFRKELMADIDMAKSVCLSKRDNLSSNPSFTINNTNQQEQNQNISLQLKEYLRKSLTGDQFDELLLLIDNKADKKTIAEKIKDFGIDVASGVLAAIISNMMV